MLQKQSEKATCRPKRLITGQGEERGVVGRRDTTGGVSFRDSGWSRRGESAGDGRRRRKKLDGGCRVRCAVCADGSFSLRNFLELLWRQNRAVFQIAKKFSSYFQAIVQLHLKSMHCCLQFAHNWDILLHHSITPLWPSCSCIKLIFCCREDCAQVWLEKHAGLHTVKCTVDMLCMNTY